MRQIAALLVLALCAVAPAFAQTTGNLPLVGVLRINTPENVEPFPTIFRDALAALGQVDGRNIRIELRLAEGHAERFPELAQALVREKASVTVTSGDAATRAAQQARWCGRGGTARCPPIPIHGTSQKSGSASRRAVRWGRADMPSTCSN